MRKIAVLTGILTLVLLVMGCGILKGTKHLLDPEKPITITVWHYYNGHIKDKFDALVTEFNETVGMQTGIVVDSQSQGDVQQLADSVLDAANKTIGAQPLPDIFAAYPDNAFRVNEISELVDFEKYFSKEEISEYRKEFLNEGRFGADRKLRIIPVAKSTEILYLNKTNWDVFSKSANVSIEDLSSWEGLVRIAEIYYQYTGKAFFSVDANANYMLLAAMQQGEEMYTYKGNRAKLNFSKEIAKKIWGNYYVPYIKGYFKKTGRFSSDDAKTASILAYTGSTAGAAYFPKEISLRNDEVHPIEVAAMPYPYFKSGQPYAFQQGAGMCITKSDTAHEYAAALFLKWFTDTKQNVDFAVSTGYLPVKNEALKEENLLSALDKSKVTNPAIYESIHTTVKMLDSYTLYSNKPFSGSYEVRALLESHLFNRLQRDLEILEKRVAKGEARAEVIDYLISEQQFNQWYQQFTQEAERILVH